MLDLLQGFLQRLGLARIDPDPPAIQRLLPQMARGLSNGPHCKGLSAMLPNGLGELEDT